LLRTWGILDEAASQGYPVKTGAEFITPKGDVRRTVFADQGPGREPQSFQVERAHFDHFLATKASERGATLVENANVVDVLQDADGRVVGVRYEKDGESHEVRARWVIDAGGRGSKLAKQYRTRKEIPWLRNVAVYRHYTGVDERHNPGYEGDIQVGGHADGWVWAIPIWADTISIGAVMSAEVLRAGESAEAVFEEHIARVPRVVQRMTGATPVGDLRVDSDYCYFSDTVYGDGWLMAGDAAHFIDPIFSGGTFLALSSGWQAALTVDRLLDDASVAGEQLDRYASFYKTGYDSYTRLISAYYESGYVLGKWLGERGFAVENDRWFARILSGDFWTDLNPLLRYLRDQRRWDTFAPFEMLTTCPVYPDLDAEERAGTELAQTA